MMRPEDVPLKDNLPSRTFPVVTVVLILANAIVFLYQTSLEVGAAAMDPGRPRISSSSSGSFRAA